MVFFTCNACGQSLKKNMVEKHYQTQCPSCEVLSCMDCGKDFWGEEYAKHTQCISEEQKYSGKDYKPKPNANKGEAKQDQWIQQVRNVISTAEVNSELKDLLEQLITFHNIPRKKPKFLNFLKNSVRIRKEETAHQAWEIFSKAQKPNVLCNTSVENSSNKNMDSCPKDEVKDSAEEKMESTHEDQAQNENSEKSRSKFKYMKLVKQILKSSDDKVSLKKLKKKVMAEYSSHEGKKENSVEEAWSKIENKIRKNPKFKIHKDKVSFTSH